jgi:hypothetical protein
MDSVATYIGEEIKINHRISQCWEDILSRIKITALAEGTRLNLPGKPTFTFIADGAPDFYIPTIQIVYNCFGDVLTVTAALVWRESDSEIANEGDCN